MFEIGAPAVRIGFSHRSGTSRVCPISRMEHERSHFFVTLGVETERTGSPASACFFSVLP
jgi:hypothetical protein